MSEQLSSHFLALQSALAGRYSLVRELGRGGMGIVYLAHEVALDRPVALKLLPPELAADEAVRRRFLQEARTAAKLSHPNIVPIHTVEEAGSFVFFAMALVEGQTLGERVRTRGPLSDADAARLMREVAWALAYAHSQGVVHRDVKPDNILLEEGTGRALVTDFGIAQIAAESPPDGDDGRDAADGSEPGRVLGTAEFMSPEQATGAPLDPRSDLYSLGVVGYYAVSGRVPFEAPSASVVLAKHVREPPPPVASVAPNVPTALARTIDRCLRKEPDRRFADGAAVAEAVARESAADRAIPVALRVFIRRLRETSQSVGAGAAVVLLTAGSALVGLLAAGEVGPVTMVGALVGSLAVGTGGYLAWLARKVLKAGHTVEDARLALSQDVMRRNEEFRFDVGERETGVDRILKRLAIGCGVVGVPALGIGLAMSDALIVTGGWLTFGSLVLAAIRGSRARRRADIAGERWLRFWGGRAGDWLFKLAGIGLEPDDAPGSGSYRPTEMAISISAARLFQDLPKETRKSLAGLPDTVEKLEADARVLRGQIEELDAVLYELDDDPGEDPSDARSRVREDVQGTRDEAAARLREVVTALETIRVGLLRMHAGERVLHSVTMELEAAAQVSGNLADLLEGHREVERILAERRATGAFSVVAGYSTT